MQVTDVCDKPQSKNPGCKLSTPGNAGFATRRAAFSSQFHSVIILTLPTSHFTGNKGKQVSSLFPLAQQIPPLKFAVALAEKHTSALLHASDIARLVRVYQRCCRVPACTASSPRPLGTHPASTPSSPPCAAEPEMHQDSGTH